ncbi:unnamed protein product, partial [Sphacelaria rigidula]
MATRRLVADDGAGEPVPDHKGPCPRPSCLPTRIQQSNRCRTASVDARHGVWQPTWVCICVPCVRYVPSTINNVWTSHGRMVSTRSTATINSHVTQREYLGDGVLLFVGGARATPSFSIISVIISS